MTPAHATSYDTYDDLIQVTFDPTRPYTYCRVCGALFQLPPSGPHVSLNPAEETELRRLWSKQHARSHSSAQHRSLALSRRWLTPEAAHRLAAYGVIDLVSLATSEEHQDAYLKAPSTPEPL